ncbi:hypothetical protein WG907_01220 [Sphingobium sp. AN558]|uniref:hypothetical protein n=1 Tax=Sphingobium sp. AN558 TaxID=3133442 RepID=UPI0030C4F58B
MSVNFRKWSSVYYGLVVDFDTNARSKDASFTLFTVPYLDHIVIVEISSCVFGDIPRSGAKKRNRLEKGASSHLSQTLQRSAWWSPSAVLALLFDVRYQEAAKAYRSATDGRCRTLINPLSFSAVRCDTRRRRLFPIVRTHFSGLSENISATQ